MNQNSSRWKRSWGKELAKFSHDASLNGFKTLAWAFDLEATGLTQQEAQGVRMGVHLLQRPQQAVSWEQCRSLRYIVPQQF